jgi:hypothetical protein
MLFLLLWSLCIPQLLRIKFCILHIAAPYARQCPKAHGLYH